MGILSSFRKLEVEKLREEKLDNLERFYQENKDELKEKFLESFRKLCRTSIEKKEIAYINYSLLRTSLLRNKNEYLVEVADENWFLDRENIKSEYNVNWAFKYLDELTEELNQARRVYMGRVKDHHIESIRLLEAEKYNRYILALIRYSLKDIDKIEEFKELDLREELEIRVGEYRDISKIAYKKDKREKNPFIIKEFLEEKDEDDSYSYQVYKGIDLKNGDYEYLDFRYCDFRESNLRESNIQNAILLGANFENSVLEKVDFKDSIINECNFKNANLKGADFSRCEGANCERRKYDWIIVGFEPIDFRGAELEDSSFNYTNLEGADFRGAKFNNTSFRGAKLYKARFLERDREKLNLEERQIKDVIWEEKV